MHLKLLLKRDKTKSESSFFIPIYEDQIPHKSLGVHVNVLGKPS